MILNTLERLLLLAALPKEGDITSLKIIRKLREDLSFTEEEHARLKFTPGPDDSINWDVYGDENREIPIGEKATDIVVFALKKLNHDKKLTEQHFSLFEKFITE
jgi:hypothetical protein